MLTADQRRDLREAMLAAFDEKGLASLALLRLDENLEAIAGNGPLPDRVLQMIRWAERQGRLSDLLNGCLLEVPRNPELSATIARLQLTPTRPSAAAPNPPAPSRVESASHSIVSRRVSLPVVLLAAMLGVAFTLGLFAGSRAGTSALGTVLGAKSAERTWQRTPFGVSLRVIGVRRSSAPGVRISLEYRNDEPPGSLYVRRSSLSTEGKFRLGSSVNLPKAAPGAVVPFDIEFPPPVSPAADGTLYLEVAADVSQTDTTLSFPVVLK